MAPCVAQVFPACAQQAAALLPSPLPGIPAEPQCQRTAWSCLGISHLLSASFTTPPPRRRVKSCLATGEACCASARWGGRNAGAFGSSGCFLKLACSCKSFPTWLCRTGWSVRCMAEPGHSHPAAVTLSVGTQLPEGSCWHGDRAATELCWPHRKPCPGEEGVTMGRMKWVATAVLPRSPFSPLVLH